MNKKREAMTNHPWYGTRIEECKMCPTRLFSRGLFEKLPWPLFNAERRTSPYRKHKHPKQSVRLITKATHYQSCPSTNIAQNIVP